MTAPNIMPSDVQPASPVPIAPSIRARLRSGIVWAVFGAVVSRLLALVVSIICARLLNLSAYGELGIIQVTVGMFGVLAGFGLGAMSTKFVAELRVTAPERAGRIIKLASISATVASAAMATLLAIFAPVLAERSLAAPHLAGALRISALTLFFSGIAGAAMGALAGFEAFRRAAIVNIATSLLSVPVILAGVAFGGVEGGAWALAFGALLSWLGYASALRAESRAHSISTHGHGWRAERRLLWSFSLPSTLASLMFAPTNWVCGALLVNRPDGYAEMGILNATNQWFGFALFLPNVLGQVLLPILSERFGAGDMAKLRRVLVATMLVNAACAIPLVFAVIAASGPIMRLYGQGLQAGASVLILAVVTGAMLAVMAPVGSFLVASGRLWTGFFMNLAWTLVIVSCTVALVDRGAVGVAAARLIAYIAHGLWTWLYARWLLRTTANKAA